jgi:putative hydrolase of the HAD superfamily
MPPIRAVLFDLDDTLYERRVAFRNWATRFIGEHGSDLTAAQIADVISELETIDGNGYGDRYRFVARLAEQFPSVTGSPDEILERFRVGFLEQLSLSPEVRDLLQTLRANDIPFGIITNGSTGPQTRKIKHLGLDALTDCIFVSESFGVKKPDPAIFHAAAKCLGVAPESILFVGDHWENDIVGAKRAGMQTAWLHYGDPSKPDTTAADYLLASLAEVGSLLPPQGEPEFRRSPVN